MNLTGAVLRDSKSGLYTAYIDNIRGVVTQGNSIEDVQQSLPKAVLAVLKAKARLEQNRLQYLETNRFSVKLRSRELTLNEQIEFAL